MAEWVRITYTFQATTGLLHFHHIYLHVSPLLPHIPTRVTTSTTDTYTCVTTPATGIGSPSSGRRESLAVPPMTSMVPPCGLETGCARFLTTVGKTQISFNPLIVSS